MPLRRYRDTAQHLTENRYTTRDFSFIKSGLEPCKTTVYISIFIVHVAAGRRVLAAASGVGNKAPQVDSNVHLPFLVELVRLG